MHNVHQQLILAEHTAKDLFNTVAARGLIIAGKSEAALCDEIVQIAREDFSI